MDKGQALNAFWNTFTKAYDQNTVPDDAVLPRITYSVSESGFNEPVVMSASIWDRGTSWKSVTDILKAIEAAIGAGGKVIGYDGGAIWIKTGTPFAQRMSDTDSSIRRIVLNIEAEYIGG